jgi:hypothetical protein
MAAVVLAVLAFVASSGAVAESDDEPLKAAQGTALAVSGASRAGSPIARLHRGPRAARAEAFVGMTRTSERRRIESIDPKDWLARYGDVQALATR